MSLAIMTLMKKNRSYHFSNSKNEDESSRTIDKEENVAVAAVSSGAAK
jgi:hypothetical protein